MSEEITTEPIVEEGNIIAEESQEGSSGEGSAEAGFQSDAETVEELQADIAEAKEQGASKEEIKQMLKEFDLKVNGKSFKAKIDLSDDEAVKRELQKAYAFNDVSKENAEIKKALTERIGKWKQDPRTALQELGVDPLEYAEALLAEELENLKKSPEQIEQEKLRKELEDYKRREEEAKSKMQQLEEERMNQEALQVLKGEIKSALDSHPTIKHNAYTERRVADLMAYYSESHPDVTAEAVLPILEQEYEKEIQAIIDNVPDKFIEKFIGKKNIERLAGKFSKPAPKKTPVTPSQAKVPSKVSDTLKKESEPSKKKSFEELMSRRY